MRSCCVKPSEGVGVREAQRECPLAACGRWLRDHLQRLCPCLPRTPKCEPEPTVHGTEVPTCRAPWTRVKRKGRKPSVRVEPAPNTSRSTSEATLPPEDADQLAAVKEKQGQFWARRLSSGTTVIRNISWSLLPASDADQPATGQLLPRSRPGSVASDALMASSSNRVHDKGPEEELKIPRMGQARRLAWEPEHVPIIIDATQPSSTLEGQVLHHLVQEEHLEPTVAELEEPRQMQLAPETQGGPASWVEPVQELPETPVLELRPVSPASAPAEPEDILAEASAPRQGPELEPQEPSGSGHGATAVMVPGLAEPETCPDPMNPWDIPGVVSAPVPGPELEPHEPSSPGPVAPAGMTPGLAEPEADPEPISACATITQDVPRTEERTILQFPADLVAEQLTLLCAVSGVGSRGWGWACPVSRAAPDLLSPGVDSCDLGPRPTFPTDSLCALRDSPHPQAFTDHRGTVGLALRDPCRPMRRSGGKVGRAWPGWEGQGRGGVLREVLPGP
ncbi:uncharacterized protein [Manis javanica]|uniref:uncharacterized protein n=1 Tax=Manis javanica TaxID=9974 RepID=UPI003C6D8857